MQPTTFYYEKYDVTIMLIALVIFVTLIYFCLKSKITSVIDPLLSNVLWCASGLSLLVGYFFAKGVTVDGFIFVLAYVMYVIGLRYFLDNSSRDVKSLNDGIYNRKNVLLFVLCCVLNLASRYEFITYALSNPSIESWVLYRFKQWEGRSFFQYILELGARPFFIYYLFILLKAKKSWRYPLILILVFNSILDIIAGGRSSLLGLAAAYGYYIFYFYPVLQKKSIRYINVYGGIFLALAILNSVLVTSFYNTDERIEDSVSRMANRLLAAGDGLEMYLSNNASEHIKLGPIEYSKATFGIFIKRVVNVETQSMGWQLYELEKGRISPISVGPNFILPLQVIMFGKIFVIPYTLLITFFTAFLRGNKFSRKYIKSQPLSFVLGLLTFQLPLDIEFFVLILCACLFIYYLFIYPIRKLTIIIDTETIFGKSRDVSVRRS